MFRQKVVCLVATKHREFVSAKGVESWKPIVKAGRGHAIDGEISGDVVSIDIDRKSPSPRRRPGLGFQQALSVLSLVPAFAGVTEFGWASCC